MKSLGWKIRQERISLGLSQGEFAKELGIQQEVLSRWELGKAKPSMKNIRKLAEKFGIEVKELTKRI